MWYCDKCKRVVFSVYGIVRSTTIDKRGNIVLRRDSGVDRSVVSRYMIDCDCESKGIITYYSELKAIKLSYVRSDYNAMVNDKFLPEWLRRLSVIEYNNIKKQVKDYVDILKTGYILKQM